ncbi:MAG: RDD family protein [bacterium]
MLHFFITRFIRLTLVVFVLLMLLVFLVSLLSGDVSLFTSGLSLGLQVISAAVFVISALAGASTVLLHIAAVQRLPEKSAFTNPFIVHQKKSISLPLGKAEAFQRCLALLETLPAKRMRISDEQNGVIAAMVNTTATTKSVFTPLKNSVEFRLTSTGDSNTEVLVSSRPLAPLAQIDYGDTLRVVAKLTSALLSNQPFTKTLEAATTQYSPDQIPSLWPRFWAFLIDRFIFLAIIVVPMLFWMGVASALHISSGIRDVWLLALALLAAIVAVVHFLLRDYRSISLGKKLMKIQAVDYVSKQPLSVRQSCKRNGFFYFPYGTVIELIAALTNPEKRRLGDRWSETIVTKRPR